MPSAEPGALVLTCEHASAAVPARYRSLFAGEAGLLDSHRGIDFGAHELARRLARGLSAPLVAGKVTRLLVELNRTRRRFSALVPEALHPELLKTFWTPHHQEVARLVEAAAARSRLALHVAVHSFTPVLGGERRNAEIGLLYDPRRRLEARFADAWHAALRARAPELRVRRNYPYLGRSDGLPTSLRRKLSATRYVGLELEVNQALALGPKEGWRRTMTVVEDSLRQALATWRR